MSEFYDMNGNLISMEEWGVLMADLDTKVVKQETLDNGLWVSTVLLGMDHSFGEGPPLIFETMVFPGSTSFSEMDMDRYSTKEEAEAGHARMVEKWANWSEFEDRHDAIDQVQNSTLSEVPTTRWFDFRQNNTGGSFDIRSERGISVSVIVEADDYEDANRRAEEIGLYFNGCESGNDCSCCGDRWYAQLEDEEGDPVPSNYGVPLVNFPLESQILPPLNWAGDNPDVFVHLKDGRFFGFHLTEEGHYVYKGDPEDLALVSAPKEITS